MYRTLFTYNTFYKITVSWLQSQFLTLYKFKRTKTSNKNYLSHFTYTHHCARLARRGTAWRGSLSHQLCSPRGTWVPRAWWRSRILSAPTPRLCRQLWAPGTRSPTCWCRQSSWNCNVIDTHLLYNTCILAKYINMFGYAYLVWDLGKEVL